eukprot:6458997-Amphidinium_carterae.2
MVMRAFWARKWLAEGATSALTSHVDRPIVPVLSLLWGIAAHVNSLCRVVESSVASSSTGTPLKTKARFGRNFAVHASCIIGWVFSCFLTSAARSMDVRTPREYLDRQSPKVERVICSTLSRNCPKFGTCKSLGAHTRIISGASDLEW